ncbi:MAG: CheR family methyltransferase [Desulfobacteraceae bacterium]
MGEPAVTQVPLESREMSDRDFIRFSGLIYETCGIRLPPVKKTMLSARLAKRLRALRIPTFDKYYEYLTSTRGWRDELHHMIDVVTTNKTGFFREPAHFEILTQEVLPELLAARGKSGYSKLRFWSAACSSGEEPFTLAMVLEEFASKSPGGLSYEILATDISIRMLQKARAAVYEEEKVNAVPGHLRRKYLMRGRGAREGLVRIVPELRSNVQFERLNLLRTGGFGLKALMDVVFCRNVVIYFNRKTQCELFRRIYDQIQPGGYLFIGHSETLHGIHDGFRSVRATVYQKPR